MTRIRNGLLAIVAGAALTACATSSNDQETGALLRAETGQSGRACLQSRDIRGYGYINDYTMTIDAIRGYYVATTLFRCPGLLAAGQAGFESRFSELCGGRADKVFTSDGACTIADVYSFDTREEAFSALDAIEEQRRAE